MNFERFAKVFLIGVINTDVAEGGGDTVLVTHLAKRRAPDCKSSFVVVAERIMNHAMLLSVTPSPERSP